MNRQYALSSEVVAKVHELVGRASTCWIGGTGAAVFDEKAAAEVAEELLDLIREHMVHL